MAVYYLRLTSSTGFNRRVCLSLTVEVGRKAIRGAGAVALRRWNEAERSRSFGGLVFQKRPNQSFCFGFFNLVYLSVPTTPPLPLKAKMLVSGALNGCRSAFLLLRDARSATALTLKIFGHCFKSFTPCSSCAPMVSHRNVNSPTFLLP